MQAPNDLIYDNAIARCPYVQEISYHCVACGIGIADLEILQDRPVTSHSCGQLCSYLDMKPEEMPWTELKEAFVSIKEQCKFR